MERELWEQLDAIARRLDNVWTSGFYRASEVVAVFLWAVVHDRPTSWACQPDNWPPQLSVPFPSQATMSRRLRSRGVRELLGRLEQALGGDPRRWWMQRIDSKPLPIGSYSKDPDARVGRAANRFAKGYKLHVVWGEGPLPSVWRVEPMNTGDATAARTLLEELPGEGYVTGDRQYDSNPLHRVASPRHPIIAQQQRPGQALGHRRHEPSRVHCLEMLRRPFGQAVLAFRDPIERCFGNLTSFAGGLGPLPSWVRRQHRVHLWVQAKLLLNALRVLNRQRLLIATA